MTQTCVGCGHQIERFCWVCEARQQRARAEKAEANLKSAAAAFDELGSVYLERAEKAEAEVARLREGIANLPRWALGEDNDGPCLVNYFGKNLVKWSDLAALMEVK